MERTRRPERKRREDRDEDEENLGAKECVLTSVNKHSPEGQETAPCSSDNSSVGSGELSERTGVLPICDATREEVSVQLLRRRND